LVRKRSFQSVACASSLFGFAEILFQTNSFPTQQAQLKKNVIGRKNSFSFSGSFKVIAVQGFFPKTN
jgi:hypothetical protein